MPISRKIHRLREELSGRARRRELRELKSELEALKADLQALVPAASRDAADHLRELHAASEAYRSQPSRDERINGHIRQHVEQSGPRQGRVLEIGARNTERSNLFDGNHYTYETMDLDPRHGTVVGDITHCPDIPSESFDVIISVDVFEHLTEPWAAAHEIVRLLRPGGVSYTSTLFSWRYHPCPIDYWRFSPACLEYLFQGLDTLECDFDLVERRRDMRKKSKVDPVPYDAFGGWRENVRVHHVGIKPSSS